MNENFLMQEINNKNFIIGKLLAQIELKDKQIAELSDAVKSLNETCELLSDYIDELENADDSCCCDDCDSCGDGCCTDDGCDDCECDCGFEPCCNSCEAMDDCQAHNEKHPAEPKPWKPIEKKEEKEEKPIDKDVDAILHLCFGNKL